MGEWSDFFEDFPEEAPQSPSSEEIEKEKFDSKIKAMNADALALIAKTKKEAIDETQLKKKQFLVSIDYCPQCVEKKLNVYRFENKTYLCECQSCGIYGAGDSFSTSLHKTASAIGDNIDWRDGSLFPACIK